MNFQTTLKLCDYRDRNKEKFPQVTVSDLLVRQFFSLVQKIVHQSMQS